MLHQGRTLLLAICLVSVYGFDRRRFPGPYCETRQPQQCCPGRDDTCTVPIHDTLCYCDQFCGEHSVEDCCPDFQDVCGTGPKPTPPAEDSEYFKYLHQDCCDTISLIFCNFQISVLRKENSLPLAMRSRMVVTLGKCIVMCTTIVLAFNDKFLRGFGKSLITKTTYILFTVLV